MNNNICAKCGMANPDDAASCRDCGQSYNCEECGWPHPCDCVSEKGKDMNGDGPAFPVSPSMKFDGQLHVPDPGMSLRDYFAAKAMEAGLIRWLEQGEKSGKTCEHKCEHAAKMAYHIADAMIAERK